MLLAEPLHLNLHWLHISYSGAKKTQCFGRATGTTEMGGDDNTHCMLLSEHDPGLPRSSSGEVEQIPNKNRDQPTVKDSK